MLKFCNTLCRSGEIGRRVGLKIRYPQGCVGSSPSFGTKLKTVTQDCFFVHMYYVYLIGID